MVITSKRGQLDNVVTYEHICDFTADMADIDPHYITLGSVCTVINGEGGLELYIADSEKQWHPIMTGSGESGSNDNEQGSGSSSGEGPFGLREIARFSGNDIEVVNQKTLQINNYQADNDKNSRMCGNINAVAIFPNDITYLPVFLGSTYDKSIIEEEDYENSQYIIGSDIITAQFYTNNILINIGTDGDGPFNPYDTMTYNIVFYGK